jgi:hypothetical protein
MADKKRVFVAFAIEDESQRNLLSGQKVHPKCPFEFIDLSVKEAYESDWKTKVRARIKGCDGAIALVSKNSSTSTGQAWEISCAREEKKKILGVRAYSGDQSTIDCVKTVAWTWDGIADFIDSL